MHIHWFNPENDLALATGATTYTPPLMARKLQAAGAVLPLWYGYEGDKVLTYGVNAKWYNKMREDFGLKVELFDHQPHSDQIPDPWGWSAYAKRYFEDEGFSADVLPTDTEIARLRELSHRRTAAAVAAELNETLGTQNLAPAAYEAFTMDEVVAWLKEHPQAYIKHPWSSSGRGVLNVNAVSETAVMKWADDSLRRQGSVMLEAAYSRVIDFARLYECHAGQCTDLGTSVFSVDRRDSYTGNLIAPEETRFGRVAQHYDAETLMLVFETLRKILERRIAPYYDGILGVDMLIDDKGMLDAVVEINLRKTMGYVANRFTEQFVHPEAGAGIFCVGLTDIIGSDTRGYTVEDHRMLSGDLQLSPVDSVFTFIVKI